MQNVDFQVQGNQLVIVVDLTQRNIAVPGFEDIKIGLNVYRPQQVSRTARHMASS